MADENAVTADAVETTADATSTTTTTIDPAEHARVVAALKAANAESAARRVKLEKIEQAEAAKKEAEMSESQKAIARAEKAEQEAAALRLEIIADRTKSATISAANTAQFGADGKQKFRNAELAYKLAKLDNADLSAETVADALKAIAKAYPEMLEGTQTTGGASPTKGQRPTSQQQPRPVITGAGRY